MFDALHDSISDLRRIILGRLTPHPGLQNLLDADFKELQLHLDRLLMHHHSERDRHKEQLAGERAAHAQEAAAVSTAHEAHLQELHFATLQQREEAADEAERALGEAEATRAREEEAARLREEDLEKKFLTQVRLPGNGNSNSHGARPVHLIITMIKWSGTSRLSIKKTVSSRRRASCARRGGRGGRRRPALWSRGCPFPGDGGVRISVSFL